MALIPEASGKAADHFHAPFGLARKRAPLSELIRLPANSACAL
jgi:hypothetical protein